MPNSRAGYAISRTRRCARSEPRFARKTCGATRRIRLPGGARKWRAYFGCTLHLDDHAGARSRGNGLLAEFPRWRQRPEVATLDAEAAKTIVLAISLRFSASRPHRSPTTRCMAKSDSAVPAPPPLHRCSNRELSAAYLAFALVGNAYRGLGVGDNVRDALACGADRYVLAKSG